MRNPIEILCEAYQTTPEELQLEVTLNPSVEYYISDAINLAQKEVYKEAYNQAIDDAADVALRFLKEYGVSYSNAETDKQSILKLKK
jgi:hypothetical protein